MKLKEKPVPRTGLGEGQQNCGDSGMTQEVGMTFSKPWEKRGILGFTEVYLGE